MRRLVAVGLIGATVLAGLVACGSSREAAEAAQAAAERVAPGQVTVLSSTLLGESGNYAVTAALRDDPDAAVRLTLRGVCETGSECERKIVPAIAEARERAAELRLVLAAFVSCGHPIVGLGRVQSDTGHGVGVTATVTAHIDDATISPVTAELDRCVAAWAASRSRGYLSLAFADPTDVPAPDGAGDPALPTEVRLTDADKNVKARFGALTAITDGRAAPLSESMHPVLTSDARDQFQERVKAAAASWLGRPDAALQYISVGDRLLPGTASRVRVYVAVDGGVRTVACTVDLAGAGAGDFRLLPDVRGPDRLYSFPFEPDLR